MMNRALATVALVWAIAVIGGFYGRLSAFQNQNPYYPVPGASNVPERDIANAWHWQPSPLWLPSYLLCKIPTNGYGITETRSGFLFRNEAKRQLYFRASTTLGFLLGLALAGIAAGAACVKSKKRKKSVEPAPRHVPSKAAADDGL
jgi:hypothetical protein